MCFPPATFGSSGSGMERVAGRAPPGWGFCQGGVTEGEREGEAEGSGNVKWTTEPSLDQWRQGQQGRLKDNETKTKTTVERWPCGQRLGAMTPAKPSVGM